MTTPELFEGLTHLGLIVLYGIAAVAATVAYLQASQYSRRRSAVILFAMALTWLLFYLFAFPIVPFSPAPAHGFWSRLGHIVTASGILALSLMIRTAERERQRFMRAHRG